MRNEINKILLLILLAVELSGCPAGSLAKGGVGFIKGFANSEVKKDNKKLRGKNKTLEKRNLGLKKELDASKKREEEERKRRRWAKKEANKTKKKKKKKWAFWPFR